LANSMACHPRATYHIAGCCHLPRRSLYCSVSWQLPMYFEIAPNPTKQFRDPLYQSTLVARACATQKWFSASSHYKHPIDTQPISRNHIIVLFVTFKTIVRVNNCGGAHDAPPDPQSVGEGDTPSPLGAYGASIRRSSLNAFDASLPAFRHFFHSLSTVSLAVNLCINCSFYIYICSFITFLSYYIKNAFLDCLRESFVLSGLDHANQFLVFSHLHFLYDST